MKSIYAGELRVRVDVRELKCGRYAHIPSERPPYIHLLEVKDKCFYLSTKWAFTGISGLR